MQISRPSLVVSRIAAPRSGRRGPSRPAGWPGPPCRPRPLAHGDGDRVGAGEEQTEAFGPFGEPAQVAAAVEEVVDELAAGRLLLTHRELLGAFVSLAKASTACSTTASRRSVPVAGGSARLPGGRRGARRTRARSPCPASAAALTLRPQRYHLVPRVRRLPVAQTSLRIRAYFASSSSPASAPAMSAPVLSALSPTRAPRLREPRAWERGLLTAAGRRRGFTRARGDAGPCPHGPGGGSRGPRAETASTRRPSALMGMRLRSLRTMIAVLTATTRTAAASGTRKATVTPLGGGPEPLIQ